MFNVPPNDFNYLPNEIISNVVEFIDLVDLNHMCETKGTWGYFSRRAKERSVVIQQSWVHRTVYNENKGFQPDEIEKQLLNDIDHIDHINLNLALPIRGWNLLDLVPKMHNSLMIQIGHDLDSSQSQFQKNFLKLSV